MVSYYTVVFSILLSLSSVVHGLTYKLDSSYSGSTFFRGFNFFTQPDPTHGFVSYVSASEAGSLAIAGTTRSGDAYMGVDYKTTLNSGGPGRKSVRISSKKSWTHGLFIADIKHMPGGICGTWPAFWTLGPNWPSSGEIDIIEGVNSQKANSMALHTSPNCVMNPTSQLGTTQTSNCDGNTNQNTGCGVLSSSTQTYGKGFNAIGGGVYAMEWTSSAIKLWFFPRNAIPTNIKNGNPSTASWGLPQANYQGCNIDAHFKSHNIVFDTTFCGDWAANVWTNDNTCKNLAGSCQDYVAANPSAFRDAYWLINSVKVYTSTPTYSAKSFAAVQNDKDDVAQNATEFMGNQALQNKTASEMQHPIQNAANQSTWNQGPLEGLLGKSAASNHPQNLSNSKSAPALHFLDNTLLSPLYGPSKDSSSSNIQIANIEAQGVTQTPPSLSHLSPVTLDSAQPHLKTSGLQRRLTSSRKGVKTTSSVRKSTQRAVSKSSVKSTSTKRTTVPTKKTTTVKKTTTFKSTVTKTVNTSSKKTTSVKSTTPTSVNQSKKTTSTSNSVVTRQTSSSSVSSLSVSTNQATSVTSFAITVATTPPLTDFIYLGCFTVDGSNLKMAWNSIWAYSDACFDTCNSLSKPYAALSGTKCFCGVTGDLGITSSNSNCNVPCPGNTATTCGGNFTTPSTNSLSRRDVPDQRNVVTLYQKNEPPPAPWTASANETLSWDDVEFLFEGCWFLDPNTPQSFELRYRLNNMTPDFCLDTCTDLDYAYAGVYWNECYCGRYIQAQEEQTCSFLCPGDQTTNCGGYSASGATAISVYRNPGQQSVNTTDPVVSINQPANTKPPVTKHTFIGCYSTDAGVSNFNLNFRSDAMTQELCFSRCPSSLFAGIYSTGCYCGTSQSAPNRSANTACNTPCPGNKGTSCGAKGNGGTALSVFKRGVTTGIPQLRRDYTALHIGDIEDRSISFSEKQQLTGLVPGKLIGSPRPITSSVALVPYAEVLEDFQPIDIDDTTPSAANHEGILGVSPYQLLQTRQDTVLPRYQTRSTIRGCYPFPSTGFNWTNSDWSMDHEACATTCRSQNMNWAGIHAADCYCATSIVDVAISDRTCDSPCANDASTTCGGTTTPALTILQVSGGEAELPDSGLSPSALASIPAGMSTVGGNVGGVPNIYIGHEQGNAISVTSVLQSVSVTTTTVDCSDEPSISTATAVPIPTNKASSRPVQERKKFEDATLDVNAVANSPSHSITKSSASKSNTKLHTPTTTLPPGTSTKSASVKTEGTAWIDGNIVTSFAGERMAGMHVLGVVMGWIGVLMVF